MSKKVFFYTFVLVATGFLLNCSADNIAGLTPPQYYCYSLLEENSYLCQKIDSVFTENVCFSPNIHGKIVDSCPNGN